MEVRKDFAKRVEALASTTPREAISNLLQALMPREPVRVRSYKAEPVGQAGKLPRAPSPLDDYDDYDSKVVADRFAKIRKGTRTRMPRTKAYSVLNEAAHFNHRYGTWRAAMVEAVVKSTCEAEALKYLADNFPRVASKGVDLGWCQSVGYISF